MKPSPYFRRVATKMLRILEQFERKEMAERTFLDFIAAYSSKLDDPKFRYIYENVRNYADDDWVTYVCTDSIDPISETKKLVLGLQPYALGKDEFSDSDLTDV
jgi:hypothetical protein